MSETVRVDKYLWATRLYKTRTLAGEACRGGKVKMDGKAVKPSKEVKEGDIITVQTPDVVRTIQVKMLVTNRVSAKLVEGLIDDLTPQQEYERVELLREFKAERRQRGTGRPTKKDRREIDELKNTD
ncbi:MAG: RNA-binding S4 domain-containing protein [Bacteroidales bacterium]|nr:RNA-binding S4 domain-containing protein [Bacteroidales bacterium]